MLREVQRAVATAQIEPVMVGGIDVGRAHDLTELVVLGRAPGHSLPMRFCVSLREVEFDDQQALLWEVITSLPFTAVLVDRNGIGAHLAENLERTGRAVGVDFTNEMKELFAVEARVQAERGKTPLPLDRDLAYQIHSIKRSKTMTMRNRYDAARNELGHADRFWGWALAIWAASAVDMAQATGQQIIDRRVPIGPGY